MSAEAPIFSDATGFRAPAINLLLLAVLLAIVSAAVAVALGVLFAPPLGVAERPPAVLPSTATTAIRHVDEPSLWPVHNRAVPAAARGALRLAVFNESDAGALASLQRNAVRLDGLIPDWLELKAAGGGDMLKNTARQGQAFDWLKRQARHVKLYPLLQTRMPERDAAMLLAVPALRSALIEKIVVTAREHGFDGVTIGLPQDAIAHRAMIAFLNELRQAFLPEGRKVIYLAEMGTAPALLSQIARQADFVIIQTQERASPDVSAGPVASQGWFEQELRASSASVPPAKLIISIGSFAADWGPRGQKTELSIQQAWEIANRSKAAITLDPATLNSVFNYRDQKGERHEVWMTDAVSVYNQATSALAASAAGIAIWRLGIEDSGLYDFAGRGSLPDRAALGKLSLIEPGQGAFENAKGALLSGREGATGSRAVSYDPAIGLIVAQTIVDTPKQAALALWPALPGKSVALTFDDGPDPVATTRILDILAARDAKATFYLIGQQAMKYPHVTRRIFDDGHDVGNHSFSHPDLGLSSPDRITAELTATQRVFEDVLGVRSALFRPPFAMTGYGYLEAKPIVSTTVSRLGYLFGGIDIDAFDYIVWSPEQIAERVVRAVRAGDGQVVLLHDAGGDRSSTIDALPLIIDTLQADGYSFVTTHELVGIPRDVMMTPYTPETFATRAQMIAGFTLISMFLWVVDVLPEIAIAAALVGAARLLLIVVAAALQTRRQRRHKPRSFEGTVAVLVPAFNEEKVVCNTVRGILSATIADRLIVTVIDDGSSDRTSDVVRETFADDPRVNVLRKPNGGKASALNHGIALTDAEVVVAIDGDTVLLPDAIERLVAPFCDPSVGAVAGKVIVGNVVNLLTRFQALEYIVGQNLERTAFELVNAIGVVPGAIGAWRRSALVQAGGYATDTLAEDADLTVSLERAGWRAVNAPDAIALTEAPETLRSFMKQRFRWMFGTLQMAFKHRGALLSRPGGVSLVILPNVAFQFAFTLIAPLMDMLTLWVLVSTGLSLVGAVSPTDKQTLYLLAAYWTLFQSVDLVTAGIGLALNGDLRAWRLLPLVILQRVTYRQLLYFVAIRALLAALKGTFVGWGKLARTGRILKPALSAREPIGAPSP